MAAADPSKSPNREKTPAEEVDTSGEKKAEAGESGCTPSLGREEDEAAGSPGAGKGAEVTATWGADKTICASAEDPTAAEKMAEAPGSRERAFDWSEAEEDDDRKAKANTEEKRSGVYFHS